MWRIKFVHSSWTRLVRATVLVAKAEEHPHERERVLGRFVADAIGKAKNSYCQSLFHSGGYLPRESGIWDRTFQKAGIASRAFWKARENRSGLPV